MNSVKTAKMPRISQGDIYKNVEFIEYAIEKEEVENVEVNPNTYLSVDLGVNNLATCTNNIGEKPFIVNGRIIKSINQYFNKKLSKLMGYVGNIGKSNRLNKLTFKRNNKVNDYFHKTSRFIINYCTKNKISIIIIGNNKGWKQNIEIGKRNNQNFVSIPFEKLIQQLKYKSKEVGIKVILIEESYTSKCSFLDLEPIEKHIKYLGRRIKRGLFRSSTGKMINADVNGSLNILRKVVPNAFTDGIEGVGLHPSIINI